MPRSVCRKSDIEQHCGGKFSNLPVDLCPRWKTCSHKPRRLAMRPRWLNRLAVFAIALVASGALFAAAAEEAGKGVDRFGDPLPENALARFGTKHLRHAGVVYS